MLHNDNLENGMLLYRETEEYREKSCECAWCGGAIYAGDDYYDFDGESVCWDCIEEAKRKAESI